MRKEEEIDRTTKAFREAVEYADKLDKPSIPPSNQVNGNGRGHVSTAPSHPTRAPKPMIPVRPSINQYTSSELAQLIQWIASDGLLRTNDQIMDEMIAILGFSRRGARIERSLQSAIERWRPRT